MRVAIFAFVNIRFVAVLVFWYANIVVGASYSSVAVPPGVSCLANLVRMEIVCGCRLYIHPAVGRPLICLGGNWICGGHCVFICDFQKNKKT